MRKDAVENQREAWNAFTGGCSRAGAYWQRYRDTKPRRYRWAHNAKCGESTRRGGIILCELHKDSGGLFLPASWEVTGKKNETTPRGRAQCRERLMLPAVK